MDTRPFDRALAYSAMIVGVCSSLWVGFFGLLIPCTAGVSAILMPVGIVGWIAAFLAGLRARKALEKTDPAWAWAEGAYIMGLCAMGLMGFTVVILLISILVGVLFGPLLVGLAGRP